MLSSGEDGEWKNNKFTYTDMPEPVQAKMIHIKHYISKWEWAGLSILGGNDTRYVIEISGGGEKICSTFCIM